MALILSIETATNICSVAIAKDGSLVAKKETSTPNAHSSQLTTQIEEILNSLHMSAHELDAIALSIGPGSYTGLRIGASVVKGLSFAIDKPVITVDTMQSLATMVLQQKTIETDALLAPMMDARRMEVYTALYTPGLDIVTEVHPLVIDDESFSEKFKKHKIYFFGNGAEKCKAIIKHPNAFFIDNIELSAEGMLMLAEQQYQKNDFADLAYFEPFYLKEFQATTPKKNILN